MCGITGVYYFASSDRVEKPLLKRMNDLLEHRGPDDEGYYLEDKVGLAMRRLSIIDLATGNQPLGNEDGSIQVICNGEIYNFPELRSELEAKGHHFKSHSDVEVMAHLYEEEGEEFVKRLRGMFAFALWDRHLEKLILGRDRIGKKPLIYALKDGRLAWASEIRSLLELSWVNREIDPAAIDLYLGLQYIPSPWTIFQDLKKLPPAHCLVVCKGKIELKRYWGFPLHEAPEKMTLEDAKVAIREKLTEATRIRMVSDVPLGAFLSGGVDSSIVVGLMSRLSSRPVKTFSIGFEEEEFSELAHAKEVASHFGTDHTEFVVKPDMADVLPKLAWHYGEPYGDSSALPSYYVARETRRHVTVALNGDGGDENFGGYRRYTAMRLLSQLDRFPLWSRNKMADFWDCLPVDKTQKPFLARADRFFKSILTKDPSQRYLKLVGIFSGPEKEKLYSDAFKSRLHHPFAEQYMAQQFDAGAGPDLINTLSYVDFASYLPECLMPKVDIATMAHSLEGRSPFLDHEFIEFVFRLKGNWKVHGFRRGKWILKESFSSMLPDKTIKRRKMGFGIPIDSWFRGRLKDMWRDQVLSPQALSRQYFEPKYLNYIFQQHVSGSFNFGYKMWVLLMLELWHHTYTAKH